MSSSGSCLSPQSYVLSPPVVPVSPPSTPLNPKLPQVVHGLSIPIGKAGYHLPRTLSDLPRTLSGAISDADEPRPPRSRQAVTNEGGSLEAGRLRWANPGGDENKNKKRNPAEVSVPLEVRRIGGTIMEGT